MHILIIGGGMVGSYLAGLLLPQAHQVTVIELREAALAALQATTPTVRGIRGSGTDPATLEVAGIRTADMVVAVTGTDVTNLVITSLARVVFAVPQVIARINNPHNSWMFTPAMGVDAALNQAELLAQLIVQAVV